MENDIVVGGVRLNPKSQRSRFITSAESASKIIVENDEQPPSNPNLLALAEKAYHVHALPERGYELLDHPADVILHGWGQSLKSALEELGRALFSVMTDISSIQPHKISKEFCEEKNMRKICCQGRDIGDLVFHFLEELLFLYGCEYFMASAFSVFKMVCHPKDRMHLGRYAERGTTSDMQDGRSSSPANIIDLERDFAQNLQHIWTEYTSMDTVTTTDKLPPSLCSIEQTSSSAVGLPHLNHSWMKQLGVAPSCANESTTVPRHSPTESFSHNQRVISSHTGSEYCTSILKAEQTDNKNLESDQANQTYTPTNPYTEQPVYKQNNAYTRNTKNKPEDKIPKPECTLNAHIFGEKFNSDKHTAGIEVKAITMHNLQITFAPGKMYEKIEKSFSIFEQEVQNFFFSNARYKNISLISSASSSPNIKGAFDVFVVVDI